MPGIILFAPHYALRHSVRPKASATGLGRGYILGLRPASDVNGKEMSVDRAVRERPLCCHPDEVLEASLKLRGAKYPEGCEVEGS